MENHSLTDLHVKIVEKVLVPPCLPSPDSILYLSNFDDQPPLRFMFTTLLVYKSPQDVNVLAGDIGKVIRDALSKVLVQYYPLAGRLRNAHNGKLQVECTGEGALFVEATSFETLSVLGDMDNLKSSFQQLMFQFPPDTDINKIHPLVIQVTRFNCGGFVMGVGVYHSLCDGKGAVQFLNALAETARGDYILSVKPVWERELLKPRDPPQLDVHSSETNIENERSAIGRSLLIDDELVQSSLVINSKVVEQIKQCLLKEGKEFCSTFEVVTALCWRARTKALAFSDTAVVKLRFAVDVRRSFNPPLPDGYYGNGFSGASAFATAQELLDASLLSVVQTIKNAKRSINDAYLRQSIDFLELNRHNKSGDMMEAYMCPHDLIVSDWRKLGFEEVNFGWGEATNVSPVEWREAVHANSFLLLNPSNGRDGVKILICMPWPALKLFETEMQAQVLGKHGTIHTTGTSISGGLVKRNCVKL